MIKKNVEKILDYASGMRAYRTIEKLTTFHRITASPGYRQAAEFCQKALKDVNIDAEILSFPSNEHTCYWTNNMFKEWEMKGGFLDLKFPIYKRLCF